MELGRGRILVTSSGVVSGKSWGQKPERSELRDNRRDRKSHP